MAKTPPTPQIPGDAPVADDPSAAGSTATDELVEVPKSTLDALLARVAALEGSAVNVARSRTEADLPDQGSVDPDVIKSPVLTKQGWIVPTGHGSNPNAPK